MMSPCHLPDAARRGGFYLDRGELNKQNTTPSSLVQRARATTRRIFFISQMCPGDVSFSGMEVIRVEPVSGTVEEMNFLTPWESSTKRGITRRISISLTNA